MTAPIAEKGPIIERQEANKPMQDTVLDQLAKLLYCCEALAEASLFARNMSDNTIAESRHICRCLSMSCINSNTDLAVVEKAIEVCLHYREEISNKYSGYQNESHFPACTDTIWQGNNMETRYITDRDDDWYALKEYLLWGLKGLACYIRQASNLGYEETEHYTHIEHCLCSFQKEKSSEVLWGYIEDTSHVGMAVLRLLDAAKTTQFGAQELTLVASVSGRLPGILVCGEDLKDLEQILIQTENKGVDVYTHDAQLVAHAYPTFKKYNHLVGNYGLNWYEQQSDFTNFCGAILLTTGPLLGNVNDDSYASRTFTTGVIGRERWRALNSKLPNGAKDFSEIVALAKTLPAPLVPEQREQTIGLGHQQNMSLIPRMVHALKHKQIEGLFLVSGCDAPYDEYNYYSTLMERIPKNHIILTCGSIKYRFNQRDFGNVAGIPRLLDAGQNSDIYSWVIFLNKLAEQMGTDGIKGLPLRVYNAWFDQKSILIHQCLMTLGLAHLELGPMRPPFMTDDITRELIQRYQCNIVLQ